SRMSVLACFAGLLHESNSFGMPGQRQSEASRLSRTRFVARVMWSTPLLVTLIVAPTTPGRGESSVGVTGGLTLSGDQDVKIVEPRVGSTESHDVTAALGPVGGTTASLWLTHFGLQVD